MYPKTVTCPSRAHYVTIEKKRSLKLKSLQEHLRATSFDTYLRLMRALLLSYDEYDFCRTLSGHFRGKRYDKVMDVADSLSSQSYEDATKHFVANQFSLLIRKYPWPKGSLLLDPEGQALKKFRQSERKCSFINRRFFLLDQGRSAYEPILNNLRAFIRYAIGDAPNVERIVAQAGFSSGASLGVHGQATHLAKKLSRGKWTCTPGALTYAYWGLMNEPRLRELLCNHHGDFHDLDNEIAKANYYSKTHLVSNNKLSFVPKTAKIHRVIAVEPLLNGFVQKGTDVVMRQNLKRLGIDLSDQSINQRLAREGSLNDDDDSFVTIDLSSASDSISTGLVRSLLPPDWFDFLNSIRSPCYELNGSVNRYHKFCSMGNGFCFPLETLLFVAACSVSGCGKPGTDFSVYGDDIVIRKRYAPSVLKLLKLMGFKTNKEKTFLCGPFRESCGADWYQGKDVRPYTLDYALDSLQNVFKWLNLTRRNNLTDCFFNDVRQVLLGIIPVDFQFYRPYQGNVDTGIDPYGSEFMAAPTVSFSRKSKLWRWRELKHVSVLDKEPHIVSDRRSSVDMYALLTGVESKSGTPAYTLRRKTRTTVTLISHGGATSQWLPLHRDTVYGASALSRG